MMTEMPPSLWIKKIEGMDPDDDILDKLLLRILDGALRGEHTFEKIISKPGSPQACKDYILTCLSLIHI